MADGASDDPKRFVSSTSRRRRFVVRFRQFPLLVRRTKNSIAIQRPNITSKPASAAKVLFKSMGMVPENGIAALSQR
jgi:hypothetical protein